MLRKMTMEGVVARPLSGPTGRTLTIGDGGTSEPVQGLPFGAERLEQDRCGLLANGAKVRDMGTRSLFGTISGKRRGLRASAADVSKALASVADMVDQGHVVVFSRTPDDEGDHRVPAQEQSV